ncbi:hypothetical protein [Nostoc sp. ChiQUE01b]|uniref:hypothetical protein n=1 Tax=Nostoc sp. ChiQUE01b TaxID=3075376 RepID=UPI002AD3D8D9|nr:hypothetical protein [Nostoc sp. ChiQUE01b]MDZ8264657.1 hypothetical protein [Nostoc sp. ChiQUE01b]
MSSRRFLPILVNLATAMTILCIYPKPSNAQVVVDLTSSFQGMRQAGQDYLEALKQDSPFASVQYSVVQGYIGQIDAFALSQPYQYCRSARMAYSFAEELSDAASGIGYAVAPPYSPTSILVAQQCSQIGQ